MKRTRYIQSLVILTLVSLSPTYAQSTDEWMPVIEKLNQQMGEAIIEGNIEKSMSFYTADAISMPNNGNILEGKEAIRKSTLNMLASGSKVNSYEAHPLFLMLCNDNIIEIGKFKIAFTLPGTPTAEQDAGKYLTIWQKEADGTLKIKLETWNSDAQPVEKDQASY